MMANKDDRGREQADALSEMLGEDLKHHAANVPVAMARELAGGDFSFLAPYQLCEALLSRITPAMRDWATPDVLREIYPETPLSRTRMQPIAGSVAAISCRAFPQLSYYPYIPVRLLSQRCRTAPLIVSIHGSSRNPKDMRDELALFAEEAGALVLAPLFPLDLERSVPDEEYKHLNGEKIRFDTALWAMIEEFSEAVGMRFDRIFLFGFSGGAQFAQRLPYVDADRLSGVVLGAPTYVTLPDHGWNWPTGLADFEGIFGKPPAWDGLRRLNHVILCGSQDNQPIAIYGQDELGVDPETFAAYGRDRLDRAAMIERKYRHIGIPVESARIDGAGHAWRPLLRAAKPYLRGWLGQGG